MRTLLDVSVAEGVYCMENLSPSHKGTGMDIHATVEELW